MAPCRQDGTKDRPGVGSLNNSPTRRPLPLSAYERRFTENLYAYGPPRDKPGH